MCAHNQKPMKLYEVRRRAWHAHAKLLIVENRNTLRLNSPRAKITPE